MEADLTPIKAFFDVSLGSLWTYGAPNEYALPMRFRAISDRMSSFRTQLISIIDGWQDLCINCFGPIAPNDTLCPNCQAPTVLEFAREMAHAQNNSREDQGAPVEWIAVYKHSPDFFYFWHLLNLMVIFSQYPLALICVSRFNHAPNKQNWVLEESLYWATGLGLMLMLMVWILFRLNDLMDWFYRSNVARDDVEPKRESTSLRSES